MFYKTWDLEKGPPLSKVEIEHYRYALDLMDKVNEVTENRPPWEETEAINMRYKKMTELFEAGVDLDLLDEESKPFL